MLLSCIEPADAGYDKRTFRCATCGYQHFIVIKIESVPRPSQRIEAKNDPRRPLDNDQQPDGSRFAPRRTNE
jgi:hypothetical protein